MTMRVVVATLLAFCVCCAEPERRSTEESGPAASPAPPESNPLKQGFTQNPDPETPGLPPPIPPFLDPVERDHARALAQQVSQEDVARAQRELDSLVEAFEREPDDAVVDELARVARSLARRGLAHYTDVETLYADYLFPNPRAEADAKYLGKLVVLTGRVAPHNMKDFADGFKLIEQNPYVHEPLLLATDYELSFVECRLARPEHQLLRDWQPIHFIAQVDGKKASDVLLSRCIVL